MIKTILAGIAFAAAFSDVAAQSNDSLQRRYPVQPFAIVSFGVKARTSGPDVKVRSVLRFFDKSGKEILAYIGGPFSDTAWQGTGNYTEAPALANSLILGIENVAGNGRIDVKDWEIDLGLTPAHRHEPQVNLDTYLRPFWKSDTIYNETVLMYASTPAPANGRLLFQPDKILSVRSFDLSTAYLEGKDYTIEGRMLTRPTGSAAPLRADTSFDNKKDFAWYNLQSQWVVVTYTHHDAWKGPVPTFKGNLLPRTMGRLSAHDAPLSIVAYGMSITRGLDVSGYDTVPPYMPTYVELFARGLKRAYPTQHLEMYNAGLPGSTVDWGALYPEQYVAALHPDLVILDFGMNDFWRMTPDTFGHYIDTMMAKIRAADPQVEFILLSNLKFDPDYPKNSDGRASWYKANLAGYADELRRREGPGVANLDMTTLSGYIYEMKKAKDCIANPLHPNDYLARWYAQGLIALLVR